MGNFLSFMNGFWWWKSNSEGDFERILADLNDQITKTQINLQTIKQRQQQWQSFLLMIHISIYASICLSYWVDRRYPYISPMRWIITSTYIHESLTWTILFLGFPLWSFSVYKLCKFYYQRKYKHYESLLDLCKSKQKLELDALKKKTKYYQMKSLIQRYEGREDVGEIQDINPSIDSSSSKDPKSTTPVMSTEAFSKDFSSLEHLKDEKYSPSWMNRLVDSVLLDDNHIQSYTTATNSGFPVLFALLCSFCYSHNGFLNQKDYDALSCYICPKCGQLNVKHQKDDQKNKTTEEIPKTKEITRKKVKTNPNTNKQA